MKFELTAELLNQIVFGMENQETVLLFDTERLDLVPADEALGLVGSHEDAERRFLPLPEWRSVDGFNLMESFVANLRNPVAREELRTILKNGRGVFRLFKNALRERPDIERLWFRHRQRVMHQRVLEWYNDWREIWGLAPYADIEQDRFSDDLVFSDFEFRPARPDEGSALHAWDRKLFEEWYPELEKPERSALYAFARAGLPVPCTLPDSRAWVAADPDGELAGFLWSVEVEVEGQRFSRALQLGVKPEYRGLGIARALVRCWHKDASERGFAALHLELPAAAEQLSGCFKTLGGLLSGSSWRLPVEPA